MKEENITRRRGVVQQTHDILSTTLSARLSSYGGNTSNDTAVLVDLNVCCRKLIERHHVDCI